MFLAETEARHVAICETECLAIPQLASPTSISNMHKEERGLPQEVGSGSDLREHRKGLLTTPIMQPGPCCCGVPLSMRP